MSSEEDIMSREIDRQDFSINRVTPARRKGFAVTTALLALTASIVMATGTTAHATATAALSKGAFQAQALYRIWNWNWGACRTDCHLGIAGCCHAG